MLYLLYGISVWTDTPNLLMVAMVASRYGFETMFPSMTMLIPLPVSGAAIIKDDTNWLDSSPVS